MDKRGTDKNDDLGVPETPEDVAVLYSWANLHGAKYRDFSASRREYRAQLRHRAAEQVRQQALIAQAEAEAAADAADAAARKAADAARSQQGSGSDSMVKQNLRQAEEAARTAAAERVEASRRAEAAAIAEAAARREEREMADAHASAERQAARYAEAELRRREISSARGRRADDAVPSHISDPYAPQPAQGAPRTTVDLPVYDQVQTPQVSYAPAPFSQAQIVEALPVRGESSGSQARPQGYHPDEPSGVRQQLYRRPGFDTPQPERRVTDSGRHAGLEPLRVETYPPRAEAQLSRAEPPRERRAIHELSSNPPSGSADSPAGSQPGSSGSAGAGAGSSGSGSGSSGGRNSFTPTDNRPPANPQANPPQVNPLRTDAPRPEAPRPEAPRFEAPYSEPPAHPNPTVHPLAMAPRESAPIAPFWEHTRPVEPAAASFEAGYVSAVEPAPGSASAVFPSHAPAPRPVSPFSQTPSDASRGRRAHDAVRFERVSGFSEASRSAGPQSPYAAAQHLPSSIGQRRPGAPEPAESTHGSDPGGPAWFYAPAGSPEASAAAGINPPAPLTSVAETLQHSRERVAARWFALKGVFEQPGSEPVEPAPVRQKEIRTPVLAVFSLAGGVGKTSLVATIGRTLSSLGEKVLLADTTSHALLPFYFGASELRQGAVRTFSPPSGSTDAPIYLVSYEVGYENAEPEKEKLVEEILSSSRGTHRILLDLTVASAWVIRYMARMSPTVLVPLAPDMNSVISLQAIEKFFQGMVDADGRPLQPIYLINQFDVSLPLHLDVREVLRRQLGDRLLPFVVHRAPEVSEALAEGMTVVDYAPESPVSGDYLNVATWLRTVAAPATAGFRNVRWSER